MMRTPLFLHEEVLLLALRDDEGTTAFGSTWKNAAGGAVVAELLLRGRLRATDDKHSKLEVRDRTPVGDPLLDEALARIAGDGKTRRGAHWVRTFAGLGSLEQRIAEGLVARGILRAEEHKMFWVIPTTRYPERDGRPESEVKQRVEHAVMSDDDDLEPRTVVLVALCKVADLLPQVLDKKRLRARKARIEALTEGDAAGAMAREAAEAAQAAAMVTTIMPAIMVTTIATN